MPASSLTQTGDRLECDVLVIGTGIAGLVFALELTEREPDRRVLLVAKGPLHEGNSRYAQGGIAIVSGDDDSLDAHLSDTLDAGAGLCHAPAARRIIESSPAAFERLRDWGIGFDTTDGGAPDLSLEGGHSRRRIHHVKDRTGRAIIDGLLAAVRRCPGLRCLERHTAVDLIVQSGPHRPGDVGEVVGAYLLDEAAGRVHCVSSTVTVLATGGGGRVFRYTSNGETATGDGVSMAYRAGAPVANLEFFQFHPTLLYHPRLNSMLLTEALRGEGAQLLLPGTGERFMSRIEPEQLELATRDRVARAIFTEMESHGVEHVLLDMRPIDPATLERKFPAIILALEAEGIDPRLEPVPVVPAAHYQCGGIVSDVDGSTALDRLLVLGEVACTGLHGANRLASNSLMEGLVMGREAVEPAARWLAEDVRLEREILDWDSKSVTDRRRASQINAHWRGLRGEMTSYAGIVRTEAGLQDLLRLIALRREMIEEYYWRHTVTTDLLELRNIALFAELLTESALHRRETRGGHFREDYPDSVPASSGTVLRRQRIFPSPSDRFERPHP